MSEKRNTKENINCSICHSLQSIGNSNCRECHNVLVEYKPKNFGRFNPRTGQLEFGEYQSNGLFAVDLNITKNFRNAFPNKSSKSPIFFEGQDLE